MSQETAELPDTAPERAPVLERAAEGALVAMRAAGWPGIWAWTCCSSAPGSCC